jgi:hypothetical protein
MQFRFNAEEWEALTIAQRVSRCRILAHEAETLAAHSATHMKSLYLDLATQWKTLSEEIERHGELPQGTPE